MAPVASPDLFPLLLTAFEQFMLADESAKFPMVFYMQVRLKGVVDRALMKKAVAQALSRHPLLCCKVQNIKGRDCWIRAGNEIPETDWNEDHWSAEKPWQQSIDLRTNIGLRAWGSQESDHATLTLQFHHACCDGIGAAQFLEDIAIVYAHSSGKRDPDTDHQPELRPLRMDLLETRNSRAGRRIADVEGSLVRRTRILLKYTLRYLRQRKLPLLHQSLDFAEDQQQGLGLLTVRLSKQETRNLREAAKRSNASLNDLLVSELMVTALAWNSRIRKQKPRFFRWKQPTICVLVPTSLRGPSDHQMPACNVVSYVFMARPTSLVPHRSELLRSIRDEMHLVHKYQAGWLFIQAIEAIRKIPGMLQLIMWRTQDSCMSTTVLSHMGNLLNTIGSRLPRQDGQIQLGNLLVEEICGIPPIRQGTAAAFSTVLMNGSLLISMRCCEDRFSQTEALELINAFANTLKRTSSQISQCSTPAETTTASASQTVVHI